MGFDIENPHVGSDDDQQISVSDIVASLFAIESDHMTPLAAGLLDLSARRDAASFILQAQFTNNLDPFATYLAMNYVDRFLSKKEIPVICTHRKEIQKWVRNVDLLIPAMLQKDKPWIVRLLSIACLSLACKMRETEFTLADFQKDEGFIFDDETIPRMEVMVLQALEWRMRSITPFCFLSFFLDFFSPAQPPLLQSLKSRAEQILLKAQSEMKLLEFKPSELAAAALLSSADELFPIQFATFRSAIAACEFVVDKERLLECYAAMGHVAAADGCKFDGISCCETPVTVLRGGHYSSSESERSSTSAAAATATSRSAAASPAAPPASPVPGSHCK